MSYEAENENNTFVNTNIFDRDKYFTAPVMREGLYVP